MATDKDAVAIGSVAIAGLMALLGEFVAADTITRAHLERIFEFMADASERSEATPKMRSDLHEMLSTHFSSLVAALPRRDSED